MNPSAVSLVPIVQGVIRASATPSVSFQGRGVTAITYAVGLYTLTLDQALPGDLAVAEAAAGADLSVTGSVIGNPRSSLLVRLGSGNITDLVVGLKYNVTAGVGITSITVGAQTGGAATDPLTTHGSGIEIIVWSCAA
jgi:hypothetical protein